MDFVMSNSKFQDFLVMCPIEFKAKHIDKIIQFEPTEAMMWGSFFETLVIGGGIGGAFSFKDVPNGEKLMNAPIYERVKQQAQLCKEWLKILGGKVLSRQEHIRTEFVDSSGQAIPVEGTLDIRYGWEDGRQAVIDLKFTGDAESGFGKFAWATPEKMDLTQIVHYGLLTEKKHKIPFPLTKYWVFDSKPAMNKKLIDVRVSENAKYHHIEKFSEVYNEISLAIAMDDWKPKNTYENCSKCKAPCKFQRIMPEDYIVEL